MAGAIGGSSRHNSIISTEIRTISLTRLNKAELTSKEVEVGDSSELFQRVENPEGEHVVLGGLNAVIAELGLAGPAAADMNQPHWVGVSTPHCFGHFPNLTFI